MYEPSGRQSPFLALMWPALAAASASEMAAIVAKQFIDFAVGETAPARAEPPWATPHSIALDLQTVRLRDFSTTQDGAATLVCAPFSLHGAAVADLAPGHSLVATLREAGLQRLFAADWRPATPEMRYLQIDDYLAGLNVLVDELGGGVNLVGLCQGGWLSLLYAARFPGKVRKLALAGAPIDIAAAPSGLSALVDSTPAALFRELVKLGDGRVLGREVQKFWGPKTPDAGDIHRLLQEEVPVDSPAFAQLEATFRNWYAWTVDLPGHYYLEVTERLYRHNELATGQFVALGKTIDLAEMRTPLFLLAARDDELVAPAQLLAVEKLVGTPAQDIRARTVPCSHVSLFVGQSVLTQNWPEIARWIVATQ
jgi:poly(3-hydroxyalkanoate) synthetase